MDVQKSLSTAWRAMRGAALNMAEFEPKGARRVPAAAQRQAEAAHGAAQRQLVLAIATANAATKRAPPKRRITDRELAQARAEMEVRALERWRHMTGFAQRCRPEIGRLAARALARRASA